MKNLIVTIIVSLTVAIGVHALWPKQTIVTSSSVTVATDTKKESALNRIKRTATIRCGYIAWPPFWDLDPNTKQLGGISKEMSDVVFDLAGWKPEYIEVVGGHEVEDLKNGKVDAMCGTGPWYVKSISEIDFTTPLAYASVYVYGREDENRFNDAAQLNSPEFTFVGLDGDVSIDLMPKYFPKAKVQALPGMTDPAQILLNVATKKADVAISDPISVGLFNKTNDVKMKQIFPNQPLVTYGLEFSVNKDEPELFNSLNGYSDMIKNMSLIEPILKKYDPDGTQFFLPAKSYQSR